MYRSGAKSPCKHYLKACCKVKAPLRSSDEEPPMKSRGCGYLNPKGVHFSITGHKDQEAQFGEFPWMVAVMNVVLDENYDEPINFYLSGGSLIHPKVVMTAAHRLNG